MSKKTVLITGATAGFGLGAAKKFAENDWKVIITGRRADRLEKIAEQLSTKTEVLPVVNDVSDREAVEKTFSSLPPEFSEIDVLVNNAGLALGTEPAQEANLDNWETMIDTNIKGLIYMTRTLLPGMVKRNRGHIINIGSIAALTAYKGGNTYGGTKAFVQQFTKNLRVDLLGTNIRVSNIEPGIAETEFSVVRFEGDTRKADAVYEGTKPLVGEDIAEIIYWISTAPEHVNIDELVVTPVCQTMGSVLIDRKSSEP